MSGVYSKEKPKKIVINNLRKSIMGGGGINKQLVQNDMISQSLSINNNNAQNAAQTSQVAKLTEQLNYYREKHDQSLIKVRFLTDKLQSYGGLNSIPDTISNEISQTDAKIKNLQELLHFRRSKQMKKLKNKVLRFVQMLQFELSEQDLNKIEDEIQIIFFLIDIFSEKYNQVMASKAEIDAIIENLSQDTEFNRQKLMQQNNYLKQRNAQQAENIRDLQIQLFGLRKQIQSPSSALGRANIHLNSLLRNPSLISTSPKNNSNGSLKLYEQTIQSLQAENQELLVLNNKLETTIKDNQYEIITYKRKYQQSQNLLQKQKVKCRELQEQLSKVQREEVRWKQRYQLMQKQKNQRIQLLERQKRALSPTNSYPSLDRIGPSGSPGSQKRGVYINLRKRIPADSKYRIQDQIMEDSGQQYYDLITP